MEQSFFTPGIILEMAIAAVFACLGALSLAPGIGIGRRATDLLGLLLLFLGVQSLHVLVAGWCGHLTRSFLAATAAAGIVALLAVPASRRAIADSVRHLLAPACRELFRGLARNPLFAIAAAIVAGYVAIHAFLFVVLAPPLTFDALTYHLSKVAHWIHTGSLYLPDLPIKRVFWPSGMELLNTWWAVFPHHEIIIETPGLFFHVLATGSVWAIARNMGLGRRAANWGALLFSVTPAVVVHGTTCLTDLPTASVFLFLLALWTSPASSEDTARRRWLLTFAAGCFSLGVKPTIAFMVPGLVLAAVPALRRHDAAALRSLLKAPRVAWGIALAAALLGSFWYIRNAIRFGNPLYPVVVGSETTDGIQSGAASLNSLRTALSMLIVDGGLFDGQPIIANLYRMTGWGWTAVCCGLPCSLLFALRSKPFRWLLLGQITALCTVLAMVRPDFSCLRFLLWIPAILAVGLVGALAAGGLPRPIVWCLAALAAWTALFNLGSGLTNATKIDWRRQFSAPGKRQHLNAAIQGRFADFVPPNEDIAVFLHREGKLYLVYGPGFTRGVFTIEAEDAPVDFAKALDDAGLRFLFYDDWPSRFPLAAESLRRQIEAGLMTDLRTGLFVRGSQIPPRLKRP